MTSARIRSALKAEDPCMVFLCFKAKMKMYKYQGFAWNDKILIRAGKNEENVFYGSECTMKILNLLSNKVLIGSKRRVECL